MCEIPSQGTEAARLCLRLALRQPPAPAEGKEVASMRALGVVICWGRALAGGMSRPRRDAEAPAPVIVVFMAHFFQ